MPSGPHLVLRLQPGGVHPVPPGSVGIISVVSPGLLAVPGKPPYLGAYLLASPSAGGAARGGWQVHQPRGAPGTDHAVHPVRRPVRGRSSLCRQARGRRAGVPDRPAARTPRGDRGREVRRLSRRLRAPVRGVRSSGGAVVRPRDEERATGTPGRIRTPTPGPCSWPPGSTSARRLFRRAGVRNVIWLWTVNIDRPGNRQRLGRRALWWPGSAYVTWTGIDGYFRVPSWTRVAGGVRAGCHADQGADLEAGPDRRDRAVPHHLARLRPGRSPACSPGSAPMASWASSGSTPAAPRTGNWRTTRPLSPRSARPRGSTSDDPFLPLVPLPLALLPGRWSGPATGLATA